jgi:hypothetical protein
LRITFNCIKVGLVAAGTFGAFSGCGGGGDAGPTFIAYARDFQGFDSWKSETFTDANALGSTHVAGERTIYLKLGPSPSATEFPLGTIIVKRTQVDGKIFAQVKRGGGFNAAGAKNWEYFELSETAAGVVSYQWRGDHPPAGEIYGSNPTDTCNVCHKAGAANDYVLAPGLTFAGIAADAGATPGDAAGTDASVDSVAETAPVTHDDAGADAEQDAGTDAEPMDATGMETGTDAQHE